MADAGEEVVVVDSGDEPCVQTIHDPLSDMPATVDPESEPQEDEDQAPKKRGVSFSADPGEQPPNKSGVSFSNESAKQPPSFEVKIIEPEPKGKDKKKTAQISEKPQTKSKNNGPQRKSSLKKGKPFASGEKPKEKDTLSVNKDALKGKESSIPNIGSSSRPDWYEELDTGQIDMFKSVFDLLDRDGGGSLDAKELYNAMQEMDIGVSLNEIEHVLKDLDKDGNGEIDFDEFLYAMSETDKYLTMFSRGEDREAEKGKYTKRQSLFFTAITRFAMKNSLGEVERYYAARLRQAPHVISCYTAGARLIGLNDQQLEQEMRRMQEEAKDQDSPYAKPLPFISIKKKKKKIVPKKKKKVPKKAKSMEAGTSEEDVVDDEVMRTEYTRSSRRKTRLLAEDDDIQTMLMQLAEKGSVVAKIPGIHMVPQICTKLSKAEDPNAVCSSLRKKRKMQQMKEKSQRQHHSAKQDAKHGKVSKPGWVIPPIVRGKAPLPIIKVDRKHKHFTIEDVPKIRKLVSKALDNYYADLKDVHVATAFQHWTTLHTDQICSPYLYGLFRKVYRAYSPHKHEEVFAICPWIPEPRYASMKTLKTIPDPYGQKFRSGIESRVSSMQAAPRSLSAKVWGSATVGATRSGAKSAGVAGSISVNVQGSTSAWSSGSKTSNISTKSSTLRATPMRAKPVAGRSNRIWK